MTGETRHTLLCLLACAALCACQTTGDPTQGGLFGWSETKARQRQAEREALLAQQTEAMRQEQRQGGGLRSEVRRNAGDLSEQQAELSQLLANAEALEREAPTPATASRARVLRRAIDDIRGDRTLSTEERWTLLGRYSAEVDRLRADAAGPDTPAAR